MKDELHRLSVTFPAATNGVPGHLIRLRDLTTGEFINTATALTIHASADGLTTATVEMLTDGNGEPIYSGTPAIDPTTGSFGTAEREYEVGSVRVRSAQGDPTHEPGKTPVRNS